MNGAQIRDSNTEAYENPGLASGLFYADAGLGSVAGIQVNFGYGYAITQGSQSKIALLLATIQEQVTAGGLTQDEAALITGVINNNVAVLSAQYGSVATANTALKPINDQIANGLVQLYSPPVAPTDPFSSPEPTDPLDSDPPTPAQAYHNLAASLLDAYYATAVVPDITRYFMQSANGGFDFSSLPSQIQDGLEDLFYEAGTKDFGRLIDNALGTGNYAYAVFQVAFVTYAPNSSNGPTYRTFADAALMLGLVPTLDGFNRLLSVTPEDAVDNATVAAFLQLAALQFNTPKQ